MEKLIPAQMEYHLFIINKECTQWGGGGGTFTLYKMLTLPIQD